MALGCGTLTRMRVVARCLRNGLASTLRKPPVKTACCCLGRYEQLVPVACVCYCSAAGGAVCTVTTTFR